MIKALLLQFSRSVGLTGAVTAALIAVLPLLSGHPNWIQVVSAFILALVFAVGHALASHVTDTALQDALNAVLDQLQVLTGGQQLPAPSTSVQRQPPNEF